MVGHNLVPRVLVNFPDASADESTLDATLSFRCPPEAESIFGSENWNVKLGDLLLPLINRTLAKPN
jgi:hypothetical protein